jgi:hypothetical protein
MTASVRIRNFREIAFFVWLMFGSQLSFFAQHWAREGTSWNYKAEIYSGGVFKNVKYMVEKDTLYHGQLCSKIINQGDISCYNRPQTEYTFSRNDSVFFWDPKFGMFQMFYDFSASLNDTWKIRNLDYYYSKDDTVYVKVLDTGSVEINGSSLRFLDIQYEFSNYINQSRLIQSLGDTAFMFFYDMGAWSRCDEWFTHGLTCYTDSSLGQVAVQFNGCKLDLGVRAERMSTKVTVYCSGESVTIRSDQRMRGNYSVFSDIGALICTGEFTNSKEEVIPLKNVSPGIYILSLIRDEQRRYYRFLVQ